MAETPTCPVATIAREIDALWRAFAANDTRQIALKKGLEHDQLEEANQVIVDRRDALEELAAFTRTTSLEGAMLQVALAKEAAEAMSSFREERWAGRVDGYMRTIEACLHSVMRLLEERAGTTRECVGAQHYLSARYDPHPALEAAVAGRGAFVEGGRTDG